MIRTLKKKFILTAMIAVTVLLVLMLGALNAVNAWSSRQETDQLLELLTRMEARGIRPDRGEGLWPPHREDDEGKQMPEPGETPFDELLNDSRLPDGGRGGFLTQPLNENDWRAAVYFTVWVQEGEVLSVDVGRIATVTEEEAEAYGRQAIADSDAKGSTGSFRYAGAASDDGRTVYVFLDVSGRRASVLRVAVLSALAGLAGWGLMFLLVWFLTKKAVKPIAENLSRQRQFVTDAGHELKTPLAIIKANTEAMEMIGGETKWSRNIEAQTTRLTDLTNSLLTLARAEEIPKEGSFAELDLSELVRHTLEMFREPMSLKELKLDEQIEPELRISGNRSQLSSLLSILTDNAVKYASAGSTVSVRLQKDGKMLRLRMENDCDELPDCAPERLFDRFFRADTARNQKTGGSGIGLSAAQVITAQHRGRLTAEYPGDRRIAFTAELPAKS